MILETGPSGSLGKMFVNEFQFLGKKWSNNKHHEEDGGATKWITVHITNLIVQTETLFEAKFNEQ